MTIRWCAVSGRFLSRLRPVGIHLGCSRMFANVRPDAAKQFDPATQYDDRFGLINLQPGAHLGQRSAMPHNSGDPTAARRAPRGGARRLSPGQIQHDRVASAPQCIGAVGRRFSENDPSVPERQIAEVLSHEGNPNRTTKCHAKYVPQEALSKFWMRISRLARTYSADHLLTIDDKWPPRKDLQKRKKVVGAARIELATPPV